MAIPSPSMWPSIETAAVVLVYAVRRLNHSSGSTKYSMKK